MNLKQLEAFVCVAEVKNFSLAAKKLYLTQPTISAHIHALERELGVKLFNRSTKDVELSADGERLYENARQMIALEKRILQDFTLKDSQVSHRITVGASTVPGQYILPQILSSFSRIYPGNRLELLEADSLRVVRMVQEGNVDVGFTGTRSDDPACVYEPFYADRLVVITPNTDEYRQYAGACFPLDRFYKERWIVREEGSGTWKETERYLKEKNINRNQMNVVATISNQETIKKSVREAMGISIISSAAVEDYVKEGALLRFTLAEGEVFRKLYMVWSKNHKPGQAARLFIQYVREQNIHL